MGWGRVPGYPTTKPPPGQGPGLPAGQILLSTRPGPECKSARRPAPPRHAPPRPPRPATPCDLLEGSPGGRPVCLGPTHARTGTALYRAPAPLRAPAGPSNTMGPRVKGQRSPQLQRTPTSVCTCGHQRAGTGRGLHAAEGSVYQSARGRGRGSREEAVRSGRPVAALLIDRFSIFMGRIGTRDCHYRR